MKLRLYRLVALLCTLAPMLTGCAADPRITRPTTDTSALHECVGCVVIYRGPICK